MGNGHSAVIIDHIIRFSMDRYGFYAEKLRESMKGITTSEFILIRILVGRSEKDLSDIRAYFEEKEYGDGKTFKQCLHNHLKGSFRTSLARIAGVYEDGQHECNESDYESQTESSLVDHIHGGHQVKGLNVSQFFLCGFVIGI